MSFSRREGGKTTPFMFVYELAHVFRCVQCVKILIHPLHNQGSSSYNEDQCLPMVGTWVDEFYVRDDRVPSLKVQNFLVRSSYWNPGCQLEKEGCSPLPVGQQLLEHNLSLLSLTQQTVIVLLQGRSLLDGGVSVRDLAGAGWQGSHRAGQWFQGLTEIDLNFWPTSFSFSLTNF